MRIKFTTPKCGVSSFLIALLLIRLIFPPHLAFEILQKYFETFITIFITSSVTLVAFSLIAIPVLFRLIEALKPEKMNASLVKDFYYGCFTISIIALFNIFVTLALILSVSKGYSAMVWIFYVSLSLEVSMLIVLALVILGLWKVTTAIHTYLYEDL